MTDQPNLRNLKFSAFLFRDFLSWKVEEMRADAIAEDQPHRESLLKIADQLAQTAALTGEDDSIE